jgi:hypothetical protein
MPTPNVLKNGTLGVCIQQCSPPSMKMSSILAQSQFEKQVEKKI